MFLQGFFDRGRVVMGCPRCYNLYMIAQEDLWNASIIRLVGVLVFYRHRKKWIILNALMKGIAERPNGLDVEVFVELIRCPDNHGMIDAQVFSTYGSLLIWALLY